jgi:AraC-like DNA-binding protein
VDTIVVPGSFDAMAAHAQMSTRTLLRRFVEETGTTPRRRLIEARIRRARKLSKTRHDLVSKRSLPGAVSPKRQGCVTGLAVRLASARSDTARASQQQRTGAWV